MGENQEAFERRKKRYKALYKRGVHRRFRKLKG